MAAFPSISQVAGSNIAAYESLFRQVDKNGTGKIGAVDAAAFLKKSGLRETILHKIWEQSDPHGRGYLDKQGFTVALKLIALAQTGKEVSLAGIGFPAPVPNMSGTPVHGRSSSPAMSDSQWGVSAEEKKKYDAIFDGLSPIDNKLSGDKVKGVFMNSKLPVDILSRIWDLSDIDKDGLLDRDEFAVAMHLVYKALEKEPTPTVLPAKLIPLMKRKKSLVGAVPVLPGGLPSTGGLRRVTPPPTSPALRSGSPSSMAFPQQAASVGSGWVVNVHEKTSCDMVFKQLDTEGCGYLTGDQVRPSLLESGLPQPTLAHIWNLCDIKLTGKLNADQFALAMHLVKQAKSGIMPPTQLTPEMIPPTFRPKPGGGADSALADLTAALVPTSTAPGVPGSNNFSAIKELDAISKEIDTLSKEKSQLQSDIREKEEVIKMKSVEVQGLQTELDKSTAQVRQLESQKAEAQKRLDELDEQKTKLDGLLAEVQVQCQEVQKSVDSLRGQISSQQSTVRAQEEELQKAQVELVTLRQEEQQLEQQIETGKTQLTTVEENLNQTNQQITQLHSKLTNLKEARTKLNGTVSQISNAIETASSTGSIPQIEELGSFNDTKFSLSQDDYFSSRATAGSSPVSSLSGFSVGSEFTSKTDDAGDDQKDDPFKAKDPFTGSGDTQTSDPFQSDDPFKDSDPFKSEVSDPFKSDAFASNPFGGDPFKSDPFGTQSTTNSDDPFGGSTNTSKDPFGSSPGTSDPFGGSATPSSTTQDPFATNLGGDPFASKSDDPFASKASTAMKDDPFASKGSMTSSDPFASVQGSTATSDPFTSHGSVATEDPFKGNDPFASDSMGGLTNGNAETKPSSSDPFASIDPFGGSAFKSDSFSKSSSTDTFGSDPFKSQDETPALPPKKSRASSTKPVSTLSNSPSTTSTASDPFQTFSADTSSLSDPFASAQSTKADSSTSSNDPFAPSGSSVKVSTSSANDPFAPTLSSKDPFGGGSSDPFSGGGDPFGSTAAGKDSATSDPFANFADFGSAKDQ